MAVTALNPVTVARTVSNGVDLTAAGTAIPASSSDQHSFVNDGSTLLRVKNTGASACVVTVYFQGTTTPNVDGMTLSTDKGRTFSVAASTGDRLLGPFPPTVYGTNVLVSYSTTSGATVTVYKPTN